jgi:hypothetical protein
VVCGRRLADGTSCRTVLALLHAGCIFGQPFRLLRFPHDAWVEQNGVWRVPTAAKLRLQQGWDPRTQGGIGPYRITADGTIDYVGIDVPELPAIFRCPHSTCTNKRVLDAAVLDLTDPQKHGASVAQQMTPAHVLGVEGVALSVNL